MFAKTGNNKIKLQQQVSKSILQITVKVISDLMQKKMFNPLTYLKKKTY